MDRLLKEFVENCSRIADFRNLGQWNPVVIKIQKPTVAGELIVVCSTEEPSSNHFPLGTLWIPLDGSLPNFKQCLKLVHQNSNSIYSHSWNLIQNYLDLNEVVHVMDFRGPQGLDGIPGPQGKDAFLSDGIPVSRGQTAMSQSRALIHTGSSVEQIAYKSDFADLALNFKFESLSPQLSFLIAHNLNTDFLDVSVWGVDKRVVSPKNIEEIDRNTLLLDFAFPIDIKVIITAKT
jgi:hypothetical protein